MRIINGKIHKDDVQKAISKLATAGFSPILYHYTSINNALEVLEKGYFWLTPAIATKSDFVPNSKLYFLSCSRIKFGGYARAKTYKCGVEFVLDGRKLANRYSGSPIDYWGESWREIAKKGGGPDAIEQFLQSDENEDRVYSDEAKISSDYITEAHIFMAKDIGDRHELYYSLILKMMLICKRDGIECYLYDNKDYFRTHRTDKAVPFSSLEKPTKTKEWGSSRDWGSNDSDVYQIIYYARNYEDIENKRAKDMVWYLSGGTQGLRFDDYVKSLENLIHNSRSGGDSRKAEVAKLMKLFKKHGCTTVRDFMEVLVEKSKALVEKRDSQKSVAKLLLLKTEV
jgi:hypothetical protein